jgi:hypothetical protein
MDDFHCSFLEGQDDMQRIKMGRRDCHLSPPGCSSSDRPFPHIKSKIAPHLNAFVIQVLDWKLVYFSEGCL